MDARKYSFLQAVLGADGASALKKAADRLVPLEQAILPRAILAWLGVIGRGDYEGSIPGIRQSHIGFQKSEDGLYDGTITIGEGVFPFQNATVYHLAASVALALGVTDYIADGRLKDVDLVRLGKSIDLLAKAAYVSSLDIPLSKGAPGPAHAPTPGGAPQAPVPGTKQKEKAPKPPGKAPPKAPTQAKLPRHSVPKAKVQLPRSVKPSKGRSFQLSERQSQSECKDCGLPLIKSGRFTGCLCFREMARYVTLAKHEDHTTITFAREVDEDALSVILETLGVSNHG